MQLVVYDLLGALLAPSDPLSIPLHRDKLFRRVSAIIKDRYFDPELGPCEVAAEAGISLRYLQELFTERGLPALISYSRFAWITPHVSCVAARCWHRPAYRLRLRL
jgi:AraC-like DNA-binding protein